MRSLYLCYFGLREPLVQTQVLPYLRQLSRSGIEVGLLTFEPNRRASWSRSEAGDWCDRLQADGIRWFSLPYHKRPSLPATTYDIAVGGWMAARLVRRHGYDVVHARAHVAAAMGAIAKRLTGCRLIFDIRGFNPEEYVDAGVWPENGLNYRLAKRVERRLLSTADGFVVLTEKARDILFPGCSDSDRKRRPVEVIPCCVDLDRFRSRGRLAQGADSPGSWRRWTAGPGLCRCAGRVLPHGRDGGTPGGGPPSGRVDVLGDPHPEQTRAYRGIPEEAGGPEGCLPRSSCPPP